MLDQDKKVISILEHTSSSFSEAVFQHLGKGRMHAGIVYASWLRHGKLPEDDPAFANCPVLLQNIIDLTDFSLPTVSQEKFADEAEKIVLRTADGLEIESVLIRMRSSGTLCISSQVGCRMGCSFCETGRLGLLRNLSTHEIVAQVYLARFLRNFSFDSIVFMGMGEPLDNYDAVSQALKVLMDDRGLAFGKSKVAVSTSGKVNEILRLAEEEKAPNLAVSVNAPNNEKRRRLMPVNRQHDMAELYDAMDTYSKKTGGSILVEYVLIEGRNDSLEDADELAEYLKGLKVKVNLIPYNPQSCDRYAPPSQEARERFHARMKEHGYLTLLRKTKGQEAMAACGQLGNLDLRLKKPKILNVLPS